MLFLSIYTFYYSWLTLTWPSTEGKISYIENDQKGSTSGPKGPLFTVNVTEAFYSYTVDGQGFYGYTPINSNSNKSKNITVYYNPKEPSESTTFYGINWVYSLTFFLGSIIIGAAACFWHIKISAITRHSS